MPMQLNGFIQRLGDFSQHRVLRIAHAMYHERVPMPTSRLHHQWPHLSREHHAVSSVHSCVQAKSLGRVNTNSRSNDLFGKWEILYASGNTGLTALEGKISTFTITRDMQYENECTSRVAGVFPGVCPVSCLGVDCGVPKIKHQTIRPP